MVGLAACVVAGLVAWRHHALAQPLLEGDEPTASTTAPSPSPSPPPPPLLLSHGSGERLWVAEVTPVEETVVDPTGTGLTTTTLEQTLLRVRGAEHARWQPFGLIGGAAIQLAHRRAELAVLLADGDWVLVSGGAGGRSGQPLPRDAAVRALAGTDAGDFWAVGHVPDHPAPTTAPDAAADVASDVVAAPPPATAPATLPATAPAAPGLILFQLHEGEWVERAVLDADPPPGARVALHVVDGRPMVAMLTGRLVRFRWFDDGADDDDEPWRDAGEITLPIDPFRVELLSLHDEPLFWAAAEKDDPGLLYRRAEDDTWAGPAALDLPAEADAAAANAWALAAGLGELRLLFETPDGAMHEQVIDVTGEPRGPAVVLAAPAAPFDPRVGRWLNLAAMILLGWVVIATLRRREGLRDAMDKVDRSALAPLWRRACAGLVDAVPLGAVVLLLEPQPEAREMNRWLLTLAGGVLVYLLHTSLAEMLLARSIGKLIFGLRVTTLDGRLPTRSALLTRNVLRLIDLLLLFFPLAMVLLSPLRQRIGDLAAGTLVVRTPQAG